MIRLAHIIFALLFFASLSSRAQVKEVRYLGKSYKVYVVRLRESNIQMYWKDEKGKLYRDFKRLGSHLKAQKREMTFAMNAGIFNPEQAPVGLYIEQGKELRPIDLKEGRGNFYLKPNAVFYIDEDDKAGVVTSEKYKEAVAGKTIRYATQSGPQLLIDGEIHPAFTEGSVNQTIRNGVGVIDEHTVVFAISQTSVSLYEFASFFREEYGCRNALYLDGAISQIYGERDKGKTFNGSFSAMIVDSRPLPSVTTATAVKKKPKLYKSVLPVADYWFDVHITDQVRGPERFWTLFKAPERKIKLACTGGGDGSTHGLVVLNGELISPLRAESGRDEAVFFITRRNEPGLMSISKYAATYADTTAIKHAFQSDRLLISGGKVLGNEDTLNHYSGVGFIKETNSLLFITTDGKTRMSLKAFTEAFRASGCSEALLLNSGANAQMLIRGVKSDLNQKIDARIPVLLSAYKK